MLAPAQSPQLPEFDLQVFETVIPTDHYLRLVAERIDFQRFRPHLAEFYNAKMGRPAIDPVRMLKILFLCFHYKLSDREVINRCQTDMAFRWFLGLGLKTQVPHHTDGTKFRQRIGDEGFQEVFQELVEQARAAGLVSDRLRLKDATHLFAAVADIKPLQLAAQVRERLLQAATPFFPDWVNEQRLRMEALRSTTAELPEGEQLAARVEYLRQAAAQLHERAAQLPPAAESDRPRRRLQSVLDLVDKLLADRADPKAGDFLFSAVDPDARVGKHGEYFVGYLIDMAIDPESELITRINVLPGNGAEAADAITLIQQEEAAHGNDVAGLSMDGIGFNGPVLRELTDPEGLNLKVTVPPPPAPTRTTFGPERFALTVLDEQIGELTCPNGQTTRNRRRNDRDTSYRYTFKPKQCRDCPLRAECLENPKGYRGRSVDKNDYVAEYQAVASRAEEPDYGETRKTHAKIERKLGETIRQTPERRARYRGLPKVLVQAVLTAVVVNVKRMVKLIGQKVLDAMSALPVRAELAAT